MSVEALRDYIERLPDLLAVAYDNARAGWDSGVTARMQQSTHALNEALQEIWLNLAAAYPEKHFGGVPAKQFLEEYVKQRYAWHYALASGPEPGPHGTIVGLLAGGGVTSDLQTTIVETVKSIRGPTEDHQEWARWIERWDAAQKRS